ncbi:uncharacterized protein [Amphiura filiformis]|uniref:uncharacterized protein n=1 Tax=Amphiura filiformis TaxID=82378 RepID=UPI003B22137F
MDFQALIILQLTLLLATNTYCQTLSPPDTDQACNCLHGRNGNNGLPGRDGISGRDGRDGMRGDPGRDGLKGDPGSKGEKGDIGIGEPGPQGPIGLTGDRGDPGQDGLRGLPGKVGPVGPSGPRGPPGPTGEVGIAGPIGLTGVGEKGEKGSNGEPGRIRKSAFNVYKTSSQVASADNEIVAFEAARVNIGSHFDLTTNRFTCQIPGVYFFSYSFHVTETDTSKNPDIYLMQDNNIVASARVESVDKVQIGSSVLLELDTGSQVWLKFNVAGEGMECTAGKCQFSGFLLYED